MGERRVVTYEELGLPQVAGAYQVHGMGRVILTKQDLTEWQDQEFSVGMLVIRAVDGHDGDHEWHFVGWNLKRAAA